MRPFKARMGKLVATLEVAEAQLLANLVGQVRQLLAGRETGSEDPLAAMVGLTMGHDSAPTDPALARLLPDFHRDDADLSAGLRILREPEVIAAKDDAAATLLLSLPAGGGQVRLDEAQARAWLVALNDIRLIFSVRLHLPEDGGDPPAARSPKDSPEYAMFATYRWLSALQESLVRALLGRPASPLS